jgi:hypothetical protein
VELSGLPAKPAELRDMNAVRNSLAGLAQAQHLDNALVLVASPTWQCFGSVFWLNTPDFDGRLLWAKDLGERNQETIAAFPGRDVYRATCAPSLEPYLPPAPGGPADGPGGAARER